MDRTALLIGNSDGIGLATTRELLDRGWRVVGISRSPSPVKHPSYEHVVADVRDSRYTDELGAVLEERTRLDLCIYCVGIGEVLDPVSMEAEVVVVEANLLGMVKTAARVIPAMVAAGGGHFIGLSSVADEMLSAEAPSYHASKAAFSNYLEGLALALKAKGVSVSNVRFGFVDTKMAKGDVRPFMMSAERAARHLLTCIEKRPIRYTAPAIVQPLVALRRWAMGWKVRMGRPPRRRSG